jgi:hypothetical protein
MTKVIQKTSQDIVQRKTGSPEVKCYYRVTKVKEITAERKAGGRRTWLAAVAGV